MSKGGRRKNAGRKNSWQSGCKSYETTTIRVPRVLRDELLELAHRLDAGEELNFVTNSEEGIFSWDP